VPFDALAQFEGQLGAVLAPRPARREVRHAAASDPARIAFPRSSFGGAFDVIPVLPPCVWTSMDIDLRRTSNAADALSAIRAAAVEPRGPASRRPGSAPARGQGR
jgi:hypothetical protein